MSFREARPWLLFVGLVAAGCATVMWRMWRELNGGRCD